MRPAEIEKPLHSHLVCRACGARVDVTVAAGADPRPLPSTAAGFAVDEAEVTFWGLCPACQSDDPIGSTVSARARSAQRRHG